MSTGIHTRAEAGVLTLAFDRLERKNSLTSAMYTALSDALEAAGPNPAIRVVVLQGHPGIFTAGNDIGEFVSTPPTDMDSPPFRFLRVLAGFPKPVVAGVCGAAVGIGTSLLLHCDCVYAGDNASFVLPFVNLGLCPEGGSGLLLPKLMGYHRAAQALLLGEPLDAQAALQAGLVNRVLPAADVDAHAQAVASKLAGKPLSALMEIKRLMKAGIQAQLREQMAVEGESFFRMVTAPAAKEAFAAFADKRKPDFARL